MYTRRIMRRRQVEMVGSRSLLALGHLVNHRDRSEGAPHVRFAFVPLEPGRDVPPALLRNLPSVNARPDRGSRWYIGYVDLPVLSLPLLTCADGKGVGCTWVGCVCGAVAVLYVEAHGSHVVSWRVGCRAIAVLALRAPEAPVVDLSLPRELFADYGRSPDDIGWKVSSAIPGP